MTGDLSERDQAILDATRRLNLATCEVDVAHAELDRIAGHVRALRDPSVQMPLGLRVAVGAAADRVVRALDAREEAVDALGALRVKVDTTVPVRVRSGG